MLVVDKSKENLLAMKEKELEIGNNKEKTLQEYKALAMEIDNGIYNHLINKIESTNLSGLSLEEQLSALEEIDKEYIDVYEKQAGYKYVYQNSFKAIHGTDIDDLDFNDLSNILIDDIRNRIRVIQGYLINVKNIQENKKALEELNLALIEESKKKDNLLNKFKELELELKRNFLNTEGRNFDTNGNLIYNSILVEYKNIGLDLNELLDNNELLNQKLNDVNELKKSSDEELLAAKICYERMPTDGNHDILETIKIDNAKVNYKLVLLYMANLISKEYSEYASIILKRKQILSLNDERRHCLEQLGIKVSIDPFERIRVNEQIDIVTSLGNNNDRIEIIRRNIGNLDALIEDKTTQNNEYLIELKDDIQLIKKKFEYTKELTDYVANVLNENNPSRVINIKDVSPKMNMQIVTQKTKGVIDRVNSMLSQEVSNEIEEEPVLEVNPTLLVEPLVVNDVKIDESKNNQEEIVEFSDVINDEKELVFPEVDDKTNKNEELFNETSNVDVVFNDTVPFDDIALFNERRDDDVFDTEKDNVTNLRVDLSPQTVVKEEVKEVTGSNDNSMPDAFWTVDESKEIESTQEETSFDDQIEVLIGDNSKVRKKVV